MLSPHAEDEISYAELPCERVGRIRTMRARAVFLVCFTSIAMFSFDAVAQRDGRSGFDNIRTLGNSDTQVVVSSACVATYDRQGYRINNGRCSGDDITRADQQYAA